MVPEPLFALNPPTFSSPIRDRFPEQDKTLRSDSNPQIKPHKLLLPLGERCLIQGMVLTVFHISGSARLRKFPFFPPSLRSASDLPDSPPGLSESLSLVVNSLSRSWVLFSHGYHCWAPLSSAWVGCHIHISSYL